CTKCEYAANIERAGCPPVQAPPLSPTELPPCEEVSTPGKTSVSDVARFLGVPAERLLKTQIYLHNGLPVMALVRGDHELNEAKLAAALGDGTLERATEEQYRKIAGCEVGFAGPVKLQRWKTKDGKMAEVRVAADHATLPVLNGVSGANKKDFHLKNINRGRDFTAHLEGDLRMATPADPCPKCGARVEFVKGIEVGHVFKLGTKYSEAMGAVYLDKEQKPRTMVMGCYGIGVSRVVAAAIEQGNDADGIRWPKAMAPFSVIIVPVETDDPKVMAEAERIYAGLAEKGVEVILDDRPERPGVRFKDADLIGIPLRLVVSARTLGAGEVEFKRRDSPKADRCPVSEALSRSLALLAS
ncbi:MAG: YbaK/EbsC family protein, partial [Elusimicrobiota bacterium]